MKDIRLFNLILWGVAGVCNLMSDDISKLSYGLVWSVLMMYLVGIYIED